VLFFMPYTHGLLGALGWSVLLALLARARLGRDGAAAALVIGACVFSHWLLDVPMHTADLPLAGDTSPKIGLGLWQHRNLSLAAELAALWAGAFIWMRAPGGTGRSRTAALLFLGLLTAVLLSTPFMPPPSGPAGFALFALAAYGALAALAAWFDHRRAERPGRTHGRAAPRQSPSVGGRIPCHTETRAQAAAADPVRDQLQPGQPDRRVVAVRRDRTRDAHGRRRRQAAVRVGAGRHARRVARHPVAAAPRRRARRRTRHRLPPVRIRPRKNGGRLAVAPDADVRLSSLQVARFVADGVLRLDGIVPRALSDAALAELARGGPPSPFGAEPGAPAAAWPGRPLAGLFRDWPALHAVLELPAVAGAIHSLVGPDPIYDHHYAHVIAAGQAWSQAWHADAIFDPRRTAFDIQLFFFFHDTPREMGGTMVLPGSHLRRINEAAIARYQNFVGQEPMACPAGSLLIGHHGVWHCGQPNRTDRTRTMFKLRLNPSVPQRLRWDTRDLHDPRIARALSRDHGWYGHEVRLEIANRLRLWRVLTGDPHYDADRWLARIENEPR
jgi:hypothetical protein